MWFLPRDPASRIACEYEIERAIKEEGQVLLGWRDVPVDNSDLAEPARRIEPVIRQVFIGRGRGITVTDALERKLYIIRKSSGHAIQALRLQHGKEFYVPSMSARTLCYKGMLLAYQVGEYYLDLKDARVESALALVHQRFSTNTFPSWDLAHPFRMICHNGEINTVRGNVNWIRARQGAISSPILGADLHKIWPLIYAGQSDSASFDNALELLVMGGYSVAHAMMMMIPEAWENHTLMDPARRAFYEYHAAMMEPWDGPASIAFTDGRQIGATLDRNGLRPSRYIVTADDLVIMGSECGCLPVPEERIVKKWRLQPGKMFLVDLEKGRIIDDKELKDSLASARPYAEWIERIRDKLDEVESDKTTPIKSKVKLLDRQQAFAYTQEELKFIMQPMAEAGEEPVGSMATDSPRAVLSKRNKTLARYSKRPSGRVPTPPTAPIREELVMSLLSSIGPNPNGLAIEEVTPPLRLEVSQPVLDFYEMEKVRHIERYTSGKFKAFELDITYPVNWGKAAVEARLASLAAQAEDAVRSGYSIIIISDRQVDRERVAIPALLALSAIHQHLVGKGLRTSSGLVVETGGAREVHHFALLGGYGAEAVHPYLALETILSFHGQDRPAASKAVKSYVKGIGKGLKKVMSKMGISTYMSYTGSQIFEAVGLARSLVDKYFTGTTSNVEGIDVFDVAEEAIRVHRAAFDEDDPVLKTMLDAGGEYAWRVRGEEHAWTPEAIAKLQHSARANSYATYKEYAALINDQSQRHMTFRGLFDFRFERCKPVPLDEVEPAAAIVKRFSTGAMSLGSISTEAHTTLAIAMNRIGGKSNTGEGGEDRRRYAPIKAGESLQSRLGKTRVEVEIRLREGDSLKSKIKQVASGRFGVTTEYLASAEMLQIKIAQGAKPGEGGQLPGRKVSEYIAELRYSTPGVELISPPPHHDIYSIEDLAQLIHDLKNSNPQALVSVKLVSEVGVATAPLVVEGCIMMRKCHLNTCPVGVATQDPQLRRKFEGKPEHVVNYFFFVAEEVRELMAQLGVRRLDELIGRTELLDMKKGVEHWKAKGLDFSRIFAMPSVPAEVARFHCETQDHGLEKALDNRLIELAQPALERGEKVLIETPIRNINRTVGTMLSHEIAKRYGHDGLPEDTIHIRFAGSAGQSFGAFLARGVVLDLVGDTNDYCGKGLSGGRISVQPSPKFRGEPSENIITGNVVLYGAIAGEAYFRGVAGERFAVRNSGARAVVEGVGDHGCEYMTGGAVVVLGTTGRNFAAGMSGGFAYVLNVDGEFARSCNTSMVDLEALLPESEDEATVKRLIENHARYTNSKKAPQVLEKGGQ